MDLVETLQQQLLSHRSSHSWQRLLVAFSGGLDSTSLLHAVARLVSESSRKELPGRLIAVHTNHFLHEDSNKWQSHCKTVAHAWRIPLICLDAATSGISNIEHTARQARYAGWEQLLQPGDLLLLAHHQDDQAETLLFRLLRGRTLSGMPVSRALGQGQLLRPLLGVPRAEIERYARQEKLSWLEDPTNQDPRFDRNFLRLGVLPLLSQRWPDANRQLAGTARRLIEERGLLNEWLQRELKELELEPLPGTLAALDIDKLLQRDEVHQLRLLRYWLLCLDVHGVSTTRLKEVARQLSAAPDRRPSIELTQQVRLQRYRGQLFLVPAQAESKPRGGTWSLKAELDLGHGTLSAYPVQASVESQDQKQEGLQVLLDPQILDVEVRYRQGGERLTVQGARHSSSLKSLFQEAGIPPWQRPHYPLLYVAQKLVLVPGVAVAAAASQTRVGWQIHWQPN